LFGWLADIQNKICFVLPQRPGRNVQGIVYAVALLSCVPGMHKSYFGMLLNRLFVNIQKKIIIRVMLIRIAPVRIANLVSSNLLASFIIWFPPCFFSSAIILASMTAKYCFSSSMFLNVGGMTTPLLIGSGIL
jgi:hypothetical protein